MKDFIGEPTVGFIEEESNWQVKCEKKAADTFARHHGWEDGVVAGYAAYQGGSPIPPPISLPYPTGYDIPQVWCHSCYPQGYISCLPQWRKAYDEGYAPGYKAGYAEHAKRVAADQAEMQAFLAAGTAIAEAKREAERNAEEISTAFAALPQKPGQQQFEPSAIFDTSVLDSVANIEDAAAEKSPSSTGLAWLGAAAVLVVGGYLLFGGKKPILG